MSTTKPIILCDFSQTIVSSVVAQARDIREGDQKNMIKHIALVQLLTIKKRFAGKLILCCDSDNYWRSNDFKYYKGHRKHQKDASFIDWDVVKETVTEMKAELSENFPYIVLEVDGTEADDIIATLANYFSENELVQTGLIETPNKVIISSTDGDFRQLQKYPNVSQWNNVDKKFIKCDSPSKYLIEHICTGDVGDNIPNICTSDEWARLRAENAPTRAKSFMTVRLNDFFEKGIEACVTKEERKNYKRNEQLVNFDKIPAAIYNKILDAYTSHEVKGSSQKVFKYLSEHRMKLLLGSYQEF